MADLKITSNSDEIAKLIENANFYLLSADKSISTLPEGKDKKLLLNCLSETAWQFVYEINNVPE